MTLDPIYEATAWDHGFAPIFDATVLDRGVIPDPPVVVTRGGMNRHDVRLLPLVGPQSPGEAW